LAGSALKPEFRVYAAIDRFDKKIWDKKMKSAFSQGIQSVHPPEESRLRFLHRVLENAEK
jgi:hypothetical protein